ncbi:RNA polymerase sigma factor [Chitinophaga qingshengii]|uniref:Sigma-70 family RNA polymerase sigma factor n=1 Tax=Chitinophaga qingshengii TaxID=1569794 RepID=A0ABR7TSI0_9BACT|nr:sigma-70 family RNA polymerase sigma factor [Chitinophaga qingshengii]MBC9932958.1 sigma-70 family RNA polymerase sigma factor [Chitinophaga qingshengii]
MNDSSHIDQTVHHLFRQASGKMVAVLVKIFGPENYTLAEDVVQDALLSGLETWKFNGIPNNPEAWQYRVAKNKAIDIIRRKKHQHHIDFSSVESLPIEPATLDQYWQEESIQDDFLGMMFACCHPDISPENQVTFILKSLCGFSTREVARAFLTSEDTISKRIYRTKEFFRAHHIRPQIPPPAQLPIRLDAVLNSLYLLFNEGYSATQHEQLIRQDIIDQAMYLCQSLLNHEHTRQPRTAALMALFCFHAARIHSRLHRDGTIIPLSQQDRQQWNTAMIAVGNNWLNKAADGASFSSFHLEAAIAYEHCIAPSYAATNWKRILAYYNALLQLTKDPVILLNRSVALLEYAGPPAALQSLQVLENHRQLNRYYLYHAVVGEIYKRMGQKDKAVACFEQARQLTTAQQEQAFLSAKIADT